MLEFKFIYLKLLLSQTDSFGPLEFEIMRVDYLIVSNESVCRQWKMDVQADLSICWSLHGQPSCSKLSLLLTNMAYMLIFLLNKCE